MKPSPNHPARAWIDLDHPALPHRWRQSVPAKADPADTDWAAAFNGLTRAAEAGLDSLDDLEKLHRRAMHILRHEYRPGTLPRLIAFSLAHPLLSPQSVATALGLSVAGASKLIDRAVEAGTAR